MRIESGPCSKPKAFSFKEGSNRTVKYVGERKKLFHVQKLNGMICEIRRQVHIQVLARVFYKQYNHI